MGIQVPDSVRTEMAMAGSWQSLPKPSLDQPAEEASLSKGIRKRKVDEEEQEGEEQESFKSRKPTWGKTAKQYPGQDSSDLDALLSTRLPLKKENIDNDRDQPKSAQQLSHIPSPESVPSGVNDDITNKGNTERVEIVGEGASVPAEAATTSAEPIVKKESADAPGETAIAQAVSMPVFKRRRGKPSSTPA